MERLSSVPGEAGGLVCGFGGRNSTFSSSQACKPWPCVPEPGVGVGVRGRRWLGGAFNQAQTAVLPRDKHVRNCEDGLAIYSSLGQLGGFPFS